MTIDESECEIFEGLAKAIDIAQATLSALSASHSHGVSPEHLSKVWKIPYDDAAWTLSVTTQ